MREISDTKEKQKIALDILTEFDLFCRNNNLRYALCYGTLLGAVRHKGFIPWDDDVDVVMPRPDYDRFLKLTRNGMSNIYKVISKDNIKNIGMAYAKVIDSRTRMYEDIYDPYESGMFIDVFPMDGVPDNDKETLRHLNRICSHIRKCNIRRMQIKKGRNLITTIPKFIAIFFARIAVRVDKESEKIEGLARKYSFENCERISLSVCSDSKLCVTDKAKFTNYIELPFEGHLFFAPSNYDEFLTKVYGDYMTLPPENEQHIHPSKVYWIQD